MLRKKSFFNKGFSLLILSAFLMGTLACSESGGGGGYKPVAPDVTALNAAITSAEAMANETAVAESADMVLVGTYWVTQEVKDVFLSAIATAIDAKNGIGKNTSQSVVDAAKASLDEAVVVFTNTRSQGTKVEGFAPPDKSALISAIAGAKGAKSGVVIAASADAVPSGAVYVTQAAMDALNTAITIAEAVAEDGGATLAGVNAQITALNAAVTVFETAKGIGTNTGMEAVDKSALISAITGANAAKSGIIVAASADAVQPGVAYVTQAAMDALNTAITAAEAVVGEAGATLAEVNAQVTALNAAVTTFEMAKDIGANTTAGKNTLTSAIDGANAAKSGIIIAASADAVPSGVAYVTQAAMDALNTAITAAEAVVGEAGATLAEVNAQVTALNAAVTAFETAKGTGTNTGMEAVDKSALISAIAGANVAKSGIIVAASADAVPSGVAYVTQAAMDALNTAITTAEAVVGEADATLAEVNAQITALSAAVTAFETAKGTGTSADLPITIGFTDKGVGAFSQENFTLSRSEADGAPKTKTITLVGIWESVQWYVDDKLKGTGATISIDAAKYTISGHTLEVEVVKDGVPWSKGTKFSVIE